MSLYFQRLKRIIKEKDEDQQQQFLSMPKRAVFTPQARTLCVRLIVGGVYRAYWDSRYRGDLHFYACEACNRKWKQRIWHSTDDFIDMNMDDVCDACRSVLLNDRIDQSNLRELIERDLPKEAITIRCYKCEDTVWSIYYSIIAQLDASSVKLVVEAHSLICAGCVRALPEEPLLCQRILPCVKSVKLE